MSAKWRKGYGGPAYEQPMLVAPSVRRLTPTECERLQAFPDGWTCLCPRSPECCADAEACCPDGPRYAAMGNAITVSVAERVLRLVHEPLVASLTEQVA